MHADQINCFNAIVLMKDRWIAQRSTAHYGRTEAMKESKHQASTENVLYLVRWSLIEIIKIIKIQIIVIRKTKAGIQRDGDRKQ